MADVFVGSRTHELRVFTGSPGDAREFAARLIEQLRDQGPTSRNPYVPMPSSPWTWTPENWRKAQDDTALNFRQGISSSLWSGPAGLEIRIEDARPGMSAEARLDQLRAYAHWCKAKSVEPDERDILALADGLECHDYVALMAVDGGE